MASLSCQSRQPHSHLNQHTEEVLKLIRDMRSRNPKLRLFQYTAIDEFSRMRFLAAYEEQSTYSSADFLFKLVLWYKRRGIAVECIQTNNGFEFTNLFSHSKKDLPTRFELNAQRFGIRHKLIRPYTPRHNGKVERSHSEV